MPVPRNRPNMVITENIPHFPHASLAPLMIDQTEVLDKPKSLHCEQNKKGMTQYIFSQKDIDAMLLSTTIVAEAIFCACNIIALKM